ncbi:MAG: hypothetical protein ACTFAL_00370 [Candidatus Electronema sp. V4]|uniref:hypothetical protein n=1 Tax=Candidatus Electronema sp. V4 TaxID=3454756 RepID=UPI00405590D4
MYTITAKLINAFTTPGGKDFPPACKVQLMGEMPMKDGQIKKQLIDLTVPADWYNKLTSKMDQIVKLPISFFAQNNNVVVFFPKGAQLSEKA